MDLRKFEQEFKGRTLTGPKIKDYCRDASIFEICPEAVTYPKDASDLYTLVRFVIDERSRDPSVSLTARSAGTDMTGGPLNDSIILDFTRYFKNIVYIGLDKAVVQPGVYYRDFEKEASKRDLLLPSYPASKELCTVGGMVANNSGGEKSLLYGKTERYTKKLKVVLSDGHEYIFEPLNKDQLEEKKKMHTFEGRIYREIYDLIEEQYDLIQKARPSVSKNSAGYALWNVWNRETFDLTKLFVGSQGTLGLITEITFQLVKPNPFCQLLVIFLNDLKPLGQVIKTVNSFKPESFESFDQHTFKLALRFLPYMIKKMKGGAFSLFFQFLPEVGMVLRGGIPQLVLIAEFSAQTQEEASRQAGTCSQALEKEFKIKTHLAKDKKEADKYWTIRRESYSLLRKISKKTQPAPFIDDIVVPPEVLSEFLPKLDVILDHYPHLTYTIAGHAGEGNFHIIPFMDLRNNKDRSIIPELSQKVYDLVISYHGSITGEHNDGLIRTPFLEQMYGHEIVELFKRVKNIFDPQNIFNPGKKVGGSKEYALSHIHR
ncbi:MAG TPA: FAD-binding oxidoreductase [Candidatus Paceibacterota bacterium]